MGGEYFRKRRRDHVASSGTGAFTPATHHLGRPWGWQRSEPALGCVSRSPAAGQKSLCRSLLSRVDMREVLQDSMTCMASTRQPSLKSALFYRRLEKFRHDAHDCVFFSLLVITTENMDTANRQTRVRHVGTKVVEFDCLQLVRIYNMTCQIFSSAKAVMAEDSCGK